MALPWHETADEKFAIITIYPLPDRYDAETYRLIKGEYRSKAYNEALLKAVQKVTMMHDAKAEIRYDEEIGCDSSFGGNTDKTKKVCGIFIGKRYKQFINTCEHVHNCATDFTAGWDAAEASRKEIDDALTSEVEAKRLKNAAAKEKRKLRLAQAENDRIEKERIAADERWAKEKHLRGY